MISKRQDVTPNENIGSVNGAFQFAGIGLAPLGSVMGGFFPIFGSITLLVAVPLTGFIASLVLRPWLLPIDSEDASEGSA